MIIAAPSLASRLHQIAWNELKSTFGIEQAVTDHRTLVLADNDPKILLCRGTDIPAVVALGMADVGLTGYDAVVEWCAQTAAEFEVRSLAPARLSFVCFVSVPSRQVKRIYTEYEAITRHWLGQTSRFADATVVVVRGSSEGMVALDPHGAGIVLVTSGKTLETNGLSDLFPLLATDLCLVYRDSFNLERWGDTLISSLPVLPCGLE